MEHRDYNYYEANAASINLGEITSSAINACTLLRLRDDDDNLNHLYLGVEGSIMQFAFREGDDLGWLGYFIGRSQCLQRLSIYYLPDGEEGHALLGGISHNQSIRDIGIHDVSNDTFTSVMRALHGLSQLEELTIDGNNSNSVGPDGWSELRTLLESGVCKLKELDLRGNNYIGNAGLDVLSNGLRGIGSSLKVLRLIDISIGNEGLLTVVQALQNCTSLDLETLQLSHNNFSSAAAGLSSLSDWLRRDEVNLQYLKLSYCSIDDVGLHALAEGAANHCTILDLDGNETITATGLRYLSDSIRSHSCRVETLDLQGIPVGDNEMEVLARGLADNRSVRNLYLEDLGDDITITSAGWVAFSRALCDTSSVNSTYLSNHTICDVWDEDDGETIPHQDIFKYLRLNGEHPQYAARCKILMSHPHLDMAPLLHWGLKCLPLAVAWFDRAKPCTTLTIYDEDSDLRQLVLDELDEAFESRELTALYEFVRGMPLEVMKNRHGLAVAAAYDEKIARIEEENKIALEQCDRKIEERDRRIEQLEEEIMRLRGW